VSARHGEASFALASAAFDHGGRMAVRFTADGAGLSPPLHWSGLPRGTASLALLVEDVDAPFPQPLVHLLLHGLSPDLSGLAEGSVPQRMARSRLFSAGRNSFGHRGWLPPSPIPGHGPHRYVFQLFALSRPFAPVRILGRGALRMELRRSALGYGQTIGAYERA
jgi:Raf kinase inhibitor-like YbhB/YbcL family protein